MTSRIPIALALLGAIACGDDTSEAVDTSTTTSGSSTSTGSAIVGTTARWLEGDPLTDIEGDPRPTTDDTADFAGADVL